MAFTDKQVEDAWRAARIIRFDRLGKAYAVDPDRAPTQGELDDMRAALESLTPTTAGSAPAEALQKSLDALHGAPFSDRCYHALKSRAESAEAGLRRARAVIKAAAEFPVSHPMENQDAANLVALAKEALQLIDEVLNED